MQAAFEIERKYLIRMPDTERLARETGASVSRMVQTYLLSDAGTHRVRRIETDAGVTFVETKKERVTALTARESERTLSQAEYGTLLRSADPKRTPIKKVRYTVPLADGVHKMEIDVYPFWRKTAVLEVELCSEDDCFDLPTYIHVIREVSKDRRFKNYALARDIPDESEWEGEIAE